MTKHIKDISKQHTVYKNSDNKRVIGVTTALGMLAKPALYRWNNVMGLEGIDTTKYVSEAATIGTLAHTMIQDYLNHDEKLLDVSCYSPKQLQLAENCLLSFYDWLKVNPFNPLLLEKPLVSEKFQYGGTIDSYGTLNGKVVLIDFKTGSGIYDEMGYQLSAYKNLLIENGYEVDYAIILNIPRSETENFQTKRYDKLDNEFQIFLNCLNIYNLKKKIKGDAL